MEEKKEIVEVIARIWWKLISTEKRMKRGCADGRRTADIPTAEIPMSNGDPQLSSS